jgi:hypothetical protein
MDRRDAIKILGLGLGGAATIGASSEKVGTAKLAATSQPEPDTTVGPVSLAGRVLMPDFLAKHQWPRYETWPERCPRCINAAGTVEEFSCSADEILLPMFPRPKNVAEEERLITSLLMASVRPYETIGSERLDLRATTWACHAIMQHDGEIASNMLVNPSMLGHFRHVLDAQKYAMLREALDTGEVADITLDSFQSSFLEEHGEDVRKRMVSVIPCRSAPRDAILLTAQPELLGVYAFSTDGNVAMAVINDFVVTKILLTSPETRPSRPTGR